MDMLDRGDKTGGFSLQEHKSFLQHPHIEVNPVWQEDDVFLGIDRCMANVDEHVGMVKGVKRKVAGTITGVAADNNIEPRGPDGVGKFGSPPFQAGRELESYTLYLPFLQLPDKIRDIA
jgi:hypothetical protein